MLSCSQRALILVLEHMGNFGIRLPPGCSCYGVRVLCLCVRMLSLYATGWPVFPKCMQLTLVRWYVAGILYVAIVGCSVWVMLCSMFLHEIGGILWLTLWRCWLHSCGMFSLLVEYGLVHRGDCKNCETCYFCFDPAFEWLSLGRADFHSA